MSSLILTVVLGLFFAWFAVFNTQNVDLNIGSSLLTIPIFMLVIVSVLVGLLLSAIISSINWVSSSLALHSRDNQIKQKSQVVENLEHKLHDLEIENAQLRNDKNNRKEVLIEQPSGSKPKSFFDRFHYSSAA